MSEAVWVVRKSQGSDDDIGLQDQRKVVPELAQELADETHGIDLGVHSGFSAHVREKDEERIDAHPDIQQMVADLRSGRYDFVVSYDDTRLARDEYWYEIRRAAVLGDTEFAFVADVEDVDSIAFNVKRIVESYVKREEIAKARKALELRSEKGAYIGTPPVGTQYDDERLYLEPDEEFDAVLRVLELKDDGNSHREVVEQVDPISSPGTVSKILDRRELYEELAETTSLKGMGNTN